MSLITTDLPALLRKVKRPGDFATHGTHDLLAPRIEVTGIGPIALPVLPAQAAQLAGEAEPAPYGRGQETLIDTNVRNCRQIGPDRIRITGRHWANTLASITERAAIGLGVSEPVQAEFYKMLVYETGSFFLSHRDTEKSPGMFATLLIVLPSEFSGGTLLVRHKDREQRIDSRAEDPSECAFAAFYADCVHEVLPIKDGTRITLVYNLLRTDRKKPLLPPDYESEQRTAVTLLRHWCEALQSGGSKAPDKIVLPLEHAYTEAELDFATLKGADAAASSLLTAAAPQAGCDLHLALLTVEEQGEPDYDQLYRKKKRSRYRHYDDEDEDDDYEMGEVYERSVTLSDWRRPDAAPCSIDEIPVEDAELAPADALADLQPDEQHFQEATGNAGASLERTYYRAALVLWPSARIFAVFAQAGIAASLGHLRDMIANWQDAGAGAEVKLRQDAIEFAGHIVASWPARQVQPRLDEAKPGDAANMLCLLTRLEDTALIVRFLNDVTAAGDYGIGDNKVIVAALGKLKPNRIDRMLERIVGAVAAPAPQACADLLRRAATRWHNDMDLSSAAERLLASLPPYASRDPQALPAYRHQAGSISLVVDVIEGLETISPSLAERAADHFLSSRKTYGMDEILVPAARELSALQSVAAGRLRSACLQHLQARIAEPLAPPADWKRDSKLGCKCQHCAGLARFLADPAEKTWTLKAAERYRAHVEMEIQAAQCDLSTETDKRRVPYSLICTKTRASYARRSRQRDRDLEDLARLSKQ